MEIKYESLVSDPEKNMKKICDFVEIDFSHKFYEPLDEVDLEDNRIGKETWKLSPQNVINTSSIGNYKTEMTDSDYNIFWGTKLTQYAMKRLKVNFTTPNDLMLSLGYSRRDFNKSLTITLGQRIEATVSYLSRLIRSIKQGRGLIRRMTELDTLH